MRLNKINIDEIAGGGFQEQFQKSFEKIIENLKDPNTSFRDKRKMVITLRSTSVDHDSLQVKDN